MKKRNYSLAQSKANATYSKKRVCIMFRKLEHKQLIDKYAEEEGLTSGLYLRSVVEKLLKLNK